MENNNIIQQIKDFIENGKPSLEIGMDGRHWQLRREPIKGDLAAIYGTSSKTGKNGKFLAYTKGGCAFGSLRSVLGSEIEPNQDWFWDWKRFSNALTAQAIAIIRADGLDKLAGAMSSPRPRILMSSYEPWVSMEAYPISRKHRIEAKSSTRSPKQKKALP